MPIRVGGGMGRRQFLRKAAAAGVAMAGCRQRLSLAGLDDANEPFRVALLADTHIPADPTETYRGFRPCENLKAAAAAIAAMQPARVVICGDAARLEGRPEDYAALSKLLEPLAGVAPVHIALGNHDDRAAFLRTVKPDDDVTPPVPGRHVVVIEHPWVRMILLDSLLYPNKTPGLLGQAQRAWLADRLPALADRPTVLCLHHTLGERDADLLDTDRFLTLVTAHPHVKAIFCGHAHVWRRDRVGALHVVNLPALGYSFNDREPVGWVSARFHRGGVDLTVLPVAGHAGTAELSASIEWNA